jgi:tetratricopeptide (TPR) repeat protein
VPRYQIRVLGGFAYEGPGAPKLRRRVAALLAYLACQRGRAVPRQELVELLWGGIRPQSGGTSLRVALTELRRALPGARWLRSVDGAVQFLADDCEIDLEELEMAVRTARSLPSTDGRRRIAAARQRYPGELLPDFELLSETYARWLRHRRERLHRLLTGSSPAECVPAASGSAPGSGDATPEGNCCSETLEVLARVLQSDSEIATRALLEGVTHTLYLQGRYEEGRRWLGEVLANGVLSRPCRALALVRAAVFAYHQDEYLLADAWLREAVELYQQLGDPQGLLSGQHHLGSILRLQGRYAEAERVYGASLIQATELRDPTSAAWSTLYLGILARQRGDAPEAERCLIDALARFERLSHPQAVAWSWCNLGALAVHRDDERVARDALRRVVEIPRALRSGESETARLRGLAHLALRRGDLEAATQSVDGCLRLQQAQRSRSGLAASFELRAGIAAARRDGRLAARLLGAAAQSRKASGAPLPPSERPEWERVRRSVDALLPPRELQRCWAAGRRESVDRLIDRLLHGAAFDD